MNRIGYGSLGLGFVRVCASDHRWFFSVINLFFSVHHCAFWAHHISFCTLRPQTASAYKSIFDTTCLFSFRVAFHNLFSNSVLHFPTDWPTDPPLRKVTPFSSTDYNGRICQFVIILIMFLLETCCGIGDLRTFVWLGTRFSCIVFGFIWVGWTLIRGFRCGGIFVTFMGPVFGLYGLVIYWALDSSHLPLPSYPQSSSSDPDTFGTLPPQYWSVPQKRQSLHSELFVSSSLAPQYRSSIYQYRFEFIGQLIRRYNDVWKKIYFLSFRFLHCSVVGASCLTTCMIGTGCRFVVGCGVVAVSCTTDWPLVPTRSQGLPGTWI